MKRAVFYAVVLLSLGFVAGYGTAKYRGKEPFPDWGRNDRLATDAEIDEAIRQARLKEKHADEELLRWADSVAAEMEREKITHK